MKKVEPAKATENVRHAIRDLVPIAEEVDASGKEITYLNIGDPIVYDFRTPEHLWEAINSDRRKCEGYANAIGSHDTRQAVADYANRMGAKNISNKDAIIFVGGSEAIILSLQALMNPGENILVPRPGYSVYNGELNYLGCEHNEYDLDEENEWQIDIETMRKSINEKTKGIVIINPNNPTGSVLTRKNLKETIDLAGEFDLPIFSDETYDQIIYDDAEFVSAASLSNDIPIISLGSISKTHLAPGFRGGWLYKQDPNGALDDYFAAIQKLCRLRLTNVAPTQAAIKAALNGPQDGVKEMVKKLQPRRDLTYKRLNEIEGLSCDKPKGAFYAFPKIDLPVKSDKEFVLSLLREKGVLVVYGSGFGQKEGTNHFRIVFLPPEETLNTAFDKIEEFIKENYS
ncbi:MAG: aminotransferase [Candidatus Diapherotrites archaeon]|uniref:Aminotransferase n=1 Tax=Candidatus Iainarchaeum sp. TaxID=3101447 RepID=A0A2D6LQE9_9ARCH|nr:aminotransferase [Candidatus Diapherotrites archaeon]|tara:strand:+ start:303 stop:1502 length:1200 start_codon:yes stop_codon:yes gene_type:complete